MPFRKRNTRPFNPRTKAYGAWSSMQRRCYVPGTEDYPNYGGRGIKVDESWRASFQQFLEDIGLPAHPKLTLDRIDPDGDYAPGNVRWATRKEQNRNKRNTIHCTYQGRTMCLGEFVELIGADYFAVHKLVKLQGVRPDDVPMLLAQHQEP